MPCVLMPSATHWHEVPRPLRRSPSWWRHACRSSCCRLAISVTIRSSNFCRWHHRRSDDRSIKARGMFVISRNTAFTCRNKLIDTKQIGRELGVQYVLEGSVRRSADEIRINVQIIDAETDAHLWAERFNYDVANLFTLQDEITSRIAVALDLELVDVEAARPIEHPDARDYILRGRAARLKPPSRESRAEAIALFEQALALDPQSVEAQSWLAIALMARVLDNMAGTAAANISRAENVAEQALVASPRSWLAHFAKGQVFRAQDRYEEAALEYETVIA